MFLSINSQIISNKTLATNPCYAASAASNRLKITSYAGFRATGAVQSHAFVSGLRLSSSRRSDCVQGRSRHVVYALFEKFTERSIKSVMLAQEWARNNGETEVSIFEFDIVDNQPKALVSHFWLDTYV